MNVELLTPEKMVFTGESNSVQLPGVDGSFEVLNNHAALISALKEGKVRIAQGAEKAKQYTITGGFVEVLKNNVVILAEKAVSAE